MLKLVVFRSNAFKSIIVKPITRRLLVSTTPHPLLLREKDFELFRAKQAYDLECFTIHQKYELANKKIELKFDFPKAEVKETAVKSDRFDELFGILKQENKKSIVGFSNNFVEALQEVSRLKLSQYNLQKVTSILIAELECMYVDEMQMSASTSALKIVNDFVLNVDMKLLNPEAQLSLFLQVYDKFNPHVDSLQLYGVIEFAKCVLKFNRQGVEQSCFDFVSLNHSLRHLTSDDPLRKEFGAFYAEMETKRCV
jgi:hypothetical protein